jgi:hypothetical protein
MEHGQGEEKREQGGGTQDTEHRTLNTDRDKGSGRGEEGHSTHLNTDQGTRNRDREKGSGGRDEGGGTQDTAQ